MKKIIIILCVFLLIFFKFSNFTILAAEEKAGLDNLIRRNNEFALSFYSQLAEDENIFYSPYSLYTTLLMLYAGAEGETRIEMERVLGIDLENKSMYSAVKEMDQKIKFLVQNQGIDFNLTNSFWAQEGYKFRDEYLGLINYYFSSEIKKVDFKSDIQIACEKINNWADKETMGRISELVTPDLLARGRTYFVLANAIYFQSEWEKQFIKEETKEEEFYTGEEEKLKVPMMKQQDKFQYYSNEKFKALELPYAENMFKMLILLPQENYSLTSLENSLDIEKLNKILEKLDNKRIEVYLPKFEIESALNLEEELKNFGLKNLFSEEANLTRMSEEDLNVSRVLQNSYLSVDEAGTEAAAASAIIDTRGIPEVFRANRPFIFIIFNDQTQSIDFMGRFIKP